MYYSTKRYDSFLPCCFRQWRAESHCRLLHGYALSVEFTFCSDDLDHRRWVVDYGGLKSLKGLLETAFDHCLVIAEDDPLMQTFLDLEATGACRLRVLPNVGMESFAEYIYGATEVWLKDAGFSPRCQLDQVRIWEHAANSAVYRK